MSLFYYIIYYLLQSKNHIFASDLIPDLYIQYFSVLLFCDPPTFFSSFHLSVNTKYKGQKQLETTCGVFSYFMLSVYSRVPLMLLHQETTSWFVPPEWGDRHQGGISPPLLSQPTRLCGSNQWSLTMCTTSMYPWSLCALLTWMHPHHLTQVMVRSPGRLFKLTAISSAVLEAHFVHIDTSFWF